jgi:hypothetical protein
VEGSEKSEALVSIFFSSRLSCFLTTLATRSAIQTQSRTLTSSELDALSEDSLLDTYIGFFMMSETKTRSPLRISPTPFKSSFLSIPPSPFSPRTPLTPKLPLPYPTQNPVQSTRVYAPAAVEAPPSPLSWVWTCHQCHRSYHLDVTRRCLEDGHHFCSGTTTVKAWRKSVSPRRVRKHRACASEFDYSGWKTWGRWRRGGSKVVQGRRLDHQQASAQSKKDCWNNCDYPSECRWGKKFGIHTPIETVFPTLEVDNSADTITASLDRTAEGILKPENCKAAKEGDKNTFWGALIASAERRKSGSERASSPLATVTEEPETEEEDGEAKKDRDGDIELSTIDSSLPSPTSSSSSSAVDSLKALIGRKRYRRTRSSSKLSLSSSKCDSEALLEGFAPLKRVQSRESGYASCSV